SDYEAIGHGPDPRKTALLDAPPTVRPCRRRNRNGRPRIAVEPADLRRGIEARGSSRAAWLSQFRSESQTDYLSAPIRRAFADGPVRSEAAARRALCRGPAGLHPARPAAHRNDVEPEELSRGAVCVQVCAARQIRRLAER